jgi:magnesium chelatase family protein
MERIDIQIHLKNTSMDIISGPSDENEERSCDVLKRVKKVKEIQQQRFTNFKSIKLNKDMSGDAIEKFCNLDIESKDLLVSASKKFNFSMREFHKILRVARTIADMTESQNILKEHLLEAISYRV